MKRSKLIKIAASALICSMILAGCKGAAEEQESEVISSQESAATEPVQRTETPELEGYTLLWSDEFDGPELDTNNWNRELRQPGWTNNELQAYTALEENSFIRDGHLVLKAIKTEDENGRPYYTSGKVNSQGLRDFMYGKVVVSAKVPEGQGLWPAIWMMPTHEDYYGQWPKCGEIDIMEVLGSQTDIAYGTLHYGEPHAEQQGIYTLTGGDTFASEFHEYSIEWEPGEIRWYIDGNLYHTCNDWFTRVDGEDDKPYPAPFDQTFFVQMNLAVGGNWPGNPDETTDFDNAEFEIDYVRVYQLDYYDTNVEKPPMIFRDATDDGNLIWNGDFSEAEPLDDEDNWFFLLFEGGQGSAAIEDGEMIITSQAEGTEEYSVQLVQPDLPMINGQSYHVTFEAKAAEPRTMIVCVSAPNCGWIRYLQDTKIDLGTEYQEYTFDFTMTERDDNYGRLEFNMGTQGSTAEIRIRNVRIEVTE